MNNYVDWEIVQEKYNISREELIEMQVKSVNRDNNNNFMLNI